MVLRPDHIIGAVAVGVGATLLMDVWNHLLKRVYGIASLNYCLLGRWISHMPDGTFRHSSIAAAARKPGECAVGWTAHYSIGIAFALALVVATSGTSLARPSLPVAFLYGIATVVFPFFVMQPSIGLGIAASRAPNPMQARMKSLATHVVFGIGLYLCAVGVGYVMHLRA